jgi:hypothetical protein
VDAAIDDEGATSPRGIPDFVAAMGVSGVNADADHVAGIDVTQIQLGERFINQMRRAIASRSGRRKDIKPARSNHGDAKRHIARID